MAKKNTSKQANEALDAFTEALPVVHSRWLDEVRGKLKDQGYTVRRVEERDTSNAQVAVLRGRDGKLWFRNLKPGDKLKEVASSYLTITKVVDTTEPTQPTEDVDNGEQ